MFLARKITLSKWATKSQYSAGSVPLAAGEIAADAVTADLRTQENALSFWQCGNGAKAEVEDAALAIAAAGERIDKLDMVWVADKELQTDGQTLRDTAGRTPVTGLAKLHVDVSRLDYVRLGKVAHRVITAIAEERCCRLKKGRVKDILAVAVRQGRVKLDDLEESVRKEVRKSLEAEP